MLQQALLFFLACKNTSIKGSALQAHLSSSLISKLGKPTLGSKVTSHKHARLYTWGTRQAAVFAGKNFAGEIF
jgi:hypothetical protein